MYQLHWATISIGQVIGIPVSTVVQPRTMLLGNILVSGFAYGLILIAVHRNLDFLFWTGTALAGLFTSTMFGPVWLWGSSFMTVTPMYSTLHFLAMSFGNMSSAANWLSL